MAELPDLPRIEFNISAHVEMLLHDIKEEDVYRVLRDWLAKVEAPLVVGHYGHKARRRDGEYWLVVMFDVDYDPTNQVVIKIANVWWSF